VIAELFQKLSRGDQIGRALGKAVADWLEADGVGMATLLAQPAGEAHRRAQFPGQCLLPARFIQRLPEEGLRLFSKFAWRAA
jgi:hypothetical protein